MSNGLAVPDGFAETARLAVPNGLAEIAGPAVSDGLAGFAGNQFQNKKQEEGK